jgi:hypothetical protein
MRLLDLILHNIGPFGDARLTLCDGPEDPVPVAIVTGDNGTGKTVILDAIRGLFGAGYGNLERPIVRKGERFWMEATAELGGVRQPMSAERTLGAHDFWTENGEVGDLPLFVQQGRARCPGWVVDFFRPVHAAGASEARGVVMPDARSYLLGALSGARTGGAMTELLCHFDYVRTSTEPRERRAGEAVWEAARAIVRAIVPGAQLADVMRRQLVPMVERAGRRIPLWALGSGAVWAVQGAIGLLGKMYAVHVLLDTEPEDISRTPGLLLVDDAEGLLDPKRQARFLRELLQIFPGLQIVATTRSPLVAASVPGARVFVCRFEEGREGSVIEESTGARALREGAELFGMMPEVGEA